MNTITIFHSDVRRVLRSWRIWASIIMSLAILLRPLMEICSTWHMYSPSELLSVPLGSSDYSPYAAFFCVIPFADSFCEDILSGYGYFIIARTHRIRYIRCRILTVACSGALVTGITMTITIVLCHLLSGQPETDSSIDFLSNTLWGKSGLATTDTIVYTELLRIVIAVLFGSLWALIGLVFSTVIVNRYLTLIGPFVLYQFLWFLLDGSIFNPVYYFRGDSAFIPSLVFLLCHQLFFIAVCILITSFGMKRRLNS